MNEVGFMEDSLLLAITSVCGSNMEVRKPDFWDRQTIVMICDSQHTIDRIRNILGRRRSPSSHTYSRGYEIDGYVNLNYSKSEKDPANRNVRIVYCNDRIMTMREVDDRFPNSYIFKVKGKEDDYDTRRISREIPQISRN